LHSAAYDRSFDPKEKNIAVIGSGSSGIQIVPTLQPLAKSLTAHLRSNTWITPSVSENLLKKLPDGSLDTRYSEDQIQEFRKNPGALIQHRQDLEGGISEGCAWPLRFLSCWTYADTSTSPLVP
jgi:cation diffusion facilitator CzcD-associated flavoprotein CzcO